jgi:pantetheine-phosphate adenylyltransferase
MNKRAIYPGTFDPITYGHLDIIRRGLLLFDEIIIAVAEISKKEILFSVQERVELIKEATREFSNLKVESFKGLVVDYARAKNIRIILRGLRMISDFEYEFQMALTNRKLAPEIETIFMMTSEKYSFISSRLIKEAVSLGADVSEFVPPVVYKALVHKLNRR